MGKQEELFDIPKIDIIDRKYTSKIKGPIYTPKQCKPQLLELYNPHKYYKLIDEINSANITIQEKEFLVLAATRHIVFNYSYIADFYAHSGKVVQELMEKSALVIIDFDKAIEYGYVKLSEDIAEQYIEDTKDDE